MKLVVDASIALSWFVRQDDLPDQAFLLESEQILIAPDLIFPETTNALWRLVTAARITPEQGWRALRALEGCFDMIAPSGPLAETAYGMASALNHPAYDCFYLALAEREGVRMLTADQKLLRKLNGTACEALATGPTV